MASRATTPSSFHFFADVGAYRRRHHPPASERRILIDGFPTGIRRHPPRGTCAASAHRGIMDPFNPGRHPTFLNNVAVMPEQKRGYHQCLRQRRWRPRAQYEPLPACLACSPRRGPLRGASHTHPRSRHQGPQRRIFITSVSADGSVRPSTSRTGASGTDLNSGCRPVENLYAMPISAREWRSMGCRSVKSNAGSQGRCGNGQPYRAGALQLHQLGHYITALPAVRAHPLSWPRRADCQADCSARRLTHPILGEWRWRCRKSSTPLRWIRATSIDAHFKRHGRDGRVLVAPSAVKEVTFRQMPVCAEPPTNIAGFGASVTALIVTASVPAAAMRLRGQGKLPRLLFRRLNTGVLLGSGSSDAGGLPFLLLGVNLAASARIRRCGTTPHQLLRLRYRAHHHPARIHRASGWRLATDGPVNFFGTTFSSPTDSGYHAVFNGSANEIGGGSLASGSKARLAGRRATERVYLPAYAGRTARLWGRWCLPSTAGEPDRDDCGLPAFTTAGVSGVD